MTASICMNTAWPALTPVSDVSNMVMDVNENTYLGEGEYAKASAAQVSAAVKVAGAPAATGSSWEDVAAAVMSGHPSESPEGAAVTGVKADTGMHRISIICRMSKFDELKSALNELGVTGMTMSQVMGCGIQKGSEDPKNAIEARWSTPRSFPRSKLR